MKPAFRFARGGKVYKELEAEEAHMIQSYLRTGIINPDDDYWMPGMGDWKKVNNRLWDFPAPGSAPGAAPGAGNVPRPTQAAEVAQSAAALAASVTPITGRTLNCECTTCKKGFNTPAKSVSGYSVIGKSAAFFILGMILLAMSWVVLLKWAIPAEIEGSQVKYVSAMCVYIFLGLCGTGLLLMSLFELISAAVTHGIYRAYPERCPYCKSHTFISKV
jgi:hypothetical protein